MPFNFDQLQLRNSTSTTFALTAVVVVLVVATLPLRQLISCHQHQVSHQLQLKHQQCSNVDADFDAVLAANLLQVWTNLEARIITLTESDNNCDKQDSRMKRITYRARASIAQHLGEQNR